MRVERLRWLVKADGPYASIYFDDSRDASDSAEQLEVKWHDIRAELERLGAAAELIGKVGDAVRNARPPVGRRGRAIVATADRVLVNEQLLSPPPSIEVRFSEYPYLLPLIELEMRRPTYVFAAVDRNGADVALCKGETVTSASIDGGGYPVHRPSSAGWKGYGDLQHTTEEAVRMNCRAVADHLTHLFDEADPEVVFVSGEVRSRSDVVSALPQRVARRVSQLHAGARRDHFDTQEIRELTAGEFARLRDAELSAVAERFQAGIGPAGLATDGLAAVCAALRDQDVQTLIVGALGDATVVRGRERTTLAPDADTLSELGEAVEGVVRADEALPFAAIAVGADVVRTDERMQPADGVAALLRYPAVDTLARR
ncbi:MULTISPECIES: Rv2629 family ribosome hibernation factor [Mycobacterium]|uniref:Peptide chain release factor 1 n=1 Tax=Mycobacterium kiyosense TaxID=2871094 RepID=A0A9P3Q678_9MYCO|nr:MULTISPECIES: hypothetical protein [Mycobacterium]BDB43263.1 hypothetical protein IWGMT90018_37090 [Mycobacterium kiyosense]BDE13539.1 hypothetical protein MKCMC460_23990 [Mycobacterium sp. 20KCMC460]GLB85408.1 hypothetical protein SRL2020028_46640 [Mycobacterium kiyosense]GLB88472.1 hypothetical protein SRL2020130_12890 [Mycobacterium kiyosense]GLB98866.1 hypothetical protein SRL2020226_56420 [Mycobacterium kiyosense]